MSLEIWVFEMPIKISKQPCCSSRFDSSIQLQAYVTALQPIASNVNKKESPGKLLSMLTSRTAIKMPRCRSHLMHNPSKWSSIERVENLDPFLCLTPLRDFKFSKINPTKLDRQTKRRSQKEVSLKRTLEIPAHSIYRKLPFTYSGKGAIFFSNCSSRRDWFSAKLKSKKLGMMMKIQACLTFARCACQTRLSLGQQSLYVHLVISLSVIAIVAIYFSLFYRISLWHPVDTLCTQQVVLK